MGFAANYLLNCAGLAAGREPARPLLFSWYATHRCSLDCGYCCDGDGKPFKETRCDELDTAAAKRLFGIIREATDTLDVTGGEPMARTDLEELLAHARALGLRTALNTKGIGLPERPELARLCDVLFLSVDSLDAGRLGAIIGRPAQTAQGVLRALDWALAHRSAGTKLVVASVARPDSLDDVADLLRFAERYQLAFQLSPEIVGTRVHPQLVTSDRWRALVNEALAAKSRGLEVLGVDPYLRGIRDFGAFRCHPLLMPTVRPDGCFNYPCLEVAKARVNLLTAGSYRRALAQARLEGGPLPDCGGQCHIFCHMAVSLLQRHPVAALGELRRWT